MTKYVLVFVLVGGLGCNSGGAGLNLRGDGGVLSQEDGGFFWGHLRLRPNGASCDGEKQAACVCEDRGFGVQLCGAGDVFGECFCEATADPEDGGGEVVLEDGGLADGGDVLGDGGADAGSDAAVPLLCPVDPCPMVMYPPPNGPWTAGCCRTDGVCGRVGGFKTDGSRECL